MIKQIVVSNIKNDAKIKQNPAALQTKWTHFEKPSTRNNVNKAMLLLINLPKLKLKKNLFDWPKILRDVTLII